MQEDATSKTFSLRQVATAFTDVPRVFRLVWDASPPLFTGMAVVMLLQGLAPLATVIIARLLIDGALQGIAHGTIQPLVLPILLQLGVSLVSRFCNRMNDTLHVLLNHRLTDSITLLILEKAGTLDLSFFENTEFYDRLTRAREEVANKPVLMIMQLFSLGSSCITLLSMLGLLFQLSWWLALIALLMPIPVFLVDSRYGLNNYWMAYWQSPRKRQQWYLSNLLTLDTFNKEIKLFNLAHYFTERYRKVSREMYQEDKCLHRKYTWISLLWSTLPVLADAGIYLYIALQAVQRRISLGALTQYTLAVSELGHNFQGMLENLSEMYQSHLFITTLFDFLAYEPKIVAPAHPAHLEMPHGVTSLDIEFRNVSFTYPDKSEPVLKNISFTLNAGESLALVGENGAGKTTLIKLLTRLYDPSEGEILIDGHNIKEYDPHELHEQIGVIFQDFVKYNATVGENIGVGRITEISNRRMQEIAAQKSGAEDMIAHLEKNYEAMLGHWFEKGADLSGGEWQKIALARAFMRNAPILILDEPTSALDAKAEYEIFQRFRNLTAGRTVIFISHRFSTVRLADRIFVLEQGHIIESGSHRELVEKSGMYAELFQMQADVYR